MASELSQFIERELKAHGYEIDEGDVEEAHGGAQAVATETTALLGASTQGMTASSSDPEAAAHSTLMGALRSVGRRISAPLCWHPYRYRYITMI